MNKTIIYIVIVAVVGALIFFTGTLVNKPVDRFNAVSGPVLPNPNFTSELGTYVVSGAFTVSTTTPVRTQNPFPASSTIDFMSLIQTGAHAGQIHFHCGTSYSTGGAPTIDILTSDVIASSTVAGLITNNVTSSQGATIGGGSVAKLIIGPTQYLICQPQVSGDVATSSASLTGNWSARFLEDKR